MKQYHSNVRGSLPSASTTHLATIRLPEGCLIVPNEDFASKGANNREPCLWVSRKRVPRIAKVVTSLLPAFETNGLWPLVLTSLEEDDNRPWLEGELDPGSSTEPAGHEALAVLREWWANEIPSEEEDDEALDALKPFGREFPGLAPSPRSAPSAAALTEVVAELSGRLGLASVPRPADAVAVIGWLGPVNHFDDMGALSAVLRSWEDRFNAFLVALGFDTLTVAVGNPPATLAAATAVAAEHFAVCSDNVYQGAGSIEAYAAELVDNAAWTFWWD